MGIRDVTEHNFAVDVLEASTQRPVVVDFWASWCGPCRQLSPLLERAAERHAKDVELVKVDVDAAPSLAARYQVQGIPSVKAFRGGRVVAEFTGAQPATVVDRFFAALVPSTADRLVAQAGGALDDAERQRLLTAALDEDPDHPQAVLAYARLLADRGRPHDALELLARIPADAEARALTAELRLGAARLDDEALEELRRRADGDEADAWLPLGRALAARGEHAAALEALLAAVRQPATRDEARAAVLEVFAVLGDGHELVKRVRRRLASVLF
jgi:putative thioredoxin